LNLKRLLQRRQLPKTMNQSEAQSLLEAHGWKTGEGGKHNIKMEKVGCRPVTLPQKQGAQYSVEMTHRILKEAGLK
jgi:predicted RNA binding protein YcfA (HicA-like mRNA interferase family)